MKKIQMIMKLNDRKLKPIKKSQGDRQDNSKDTSKENSVEYFENYKHTSQTYCILCVICQNWLHESFTLLRNDCSICVKLKALSG